jgi:hypothetical protein
LAYLDNEVEVEFQGCELTAPKDLGIEARGNSKVQMRDTTVKLCGDTALLVLDEATIDLSGCTFQGNKRDAIELSTTSQKNSIATSAISENPEGAGIICAGAGKLKISGVEISGCASALIVLDGFTVEGELSVENTLSVAGDFPVIAASGGSKVDLKGGVITGACLVGIAVTSGSSVTCTKTKITELAHGSSVTGGSTLVFKQCTLENVEKCGIEAHDDATLNVSDTQLHECGEIGVLIQNGVRGSLKRTSITACDYGLHLVSNEAEKAAEEETPTPDFVFEDCTFGNCRHNGADLKFTAASFLRCAFENNQAGEAAEGAEEAEEPEAANGVDIRGNGNEASTLCSFTKCRFVSNDQGALISEYASPTFTDCEFTENGIGFWITGGSGKLVGCTVSQSGQAGIWADGATDAYAENCTVTDTQTIAVLVEGEETSFEFTGCTFTNTVETAGVGAKDNGTVTLTDCTLSGNNSANIDISGKGQAYITNCTVSGSQKGIGIKVSGDGTNAEIRQGSVSAETAAGVLVANLAKCTIAQVEISECGTCGICIQSGASGEITENSIHNIERVGVQVDNGKPSIVKNEIKSCGTYGIHICAGAEPQVVENIFSGNGTLDVNRE